MAKCFTAAAGRPLASLVAGSIVFGRFRLGDSGSEEAVVGLLSANEIEVHCHGGVAVAESVCQALVQAGAVRIPWQGWIEPAAPDAIAAAAIAALPLAQTQRTAAILLDQYRGALRSELIAIDGLIQDGQLQAAAGRLDVLLAQQDIGLHLTQPWRVVLTGRPNAGKSSLLNALLGYRRAIVFEQPGTTRDVLTASTAIDGWPVELADTAGLREADGAIEAVGVTRAFSAVAAANVVLLVADTTALWDGPLHERIFSCANQVLVVHNKCDLKAPDATRPPGIAVSAVTGEGAPNLLAAISAAIVPEPPPPAAAVPFNLEQIAALQQCGHDLHQGKVTAARAVLVGITAPGVRS